jgi:hypothetical protein
MKTGDRNAEIDESFGAMSLNSPEISDKARSFV